MQKKGIIIKIISKSKVLFALLILVTITFIACGKKVGVKTMSVQDIQSLARLLPVRPGMDLYTMAEAKLTITPSIPILPTITPTPTITPAPTSTPTPMIQEVTLVAVGDNLLHQKAIDSGLREDGTYNYDHLFSYLKDEFLEADLAVINQETIFGSKEMGYSGYPRFCSPTQVGDAIIKAGFDVVLHATNHAVDKGVKAIEHTLDYWNQHPDIKVLGLHSSYESYQEITVVESNGIKIAMLNYTYGTNGLTLPKDKYYYVNDFNEENIRRDIERAKEISDFIIVFPHWGSEYIYHENDFQKRWTKFFAEQGVDLVIGTHPHVLQPVEWISNSEGKQMLVYYSIGNYVSTMDYTDRMLGGMADVTIVKEGDEVYIKEAFLIPIVTHYERGGNYNLCVYKLTDYKEELAKKHYILKNYRGKDFSMEQLHALTKEIVGDWVGE